MENTTKDKVIIPADLDIDPISNGARYIFQLINCVILCEVISFFGIGANIVNICVFSKQGFKDSINISLMSLAISDFACSISMFCSNLFYNPLFHDSEQSFAPLEVMYVTLGYPHECFIRITSFITAFITLERCLCIAMPLKVKNIITHFRTKVINISIFISMIVLFCPFYFVNHLGWVFSVSHNRSIFGLTFAKDREIVDSVTYFIHSVFFTTSLLLSVAICTVILVFKLNQKSKWRECSSAQTTHKPDMASLKDKKVVRMITMIAAIFVACYVPPLAVILLMVFCPDFSIAGNYQNLFFVTWSFAFLPEAINSSVNIFVYLKMSSKFRETIGKLLSFKVFQFEREFVLREHETSLTR